MPKLASRESVRLALMIALQAELDWQCYRLCGIIEEDLTLSPDRIPPLQLGERAFKIVLARAVDTSALAKNYHSTYYPLVLDWSCHPEA